METFNICPKCGTKDNDFPGSYCAKCRSEAGNDNPRDWETAGGIFIKIVVPALMGAMMLPVSDPPMIWQGVVCFVLGMIALYIAIRQVT